MCKLQRFHGSAKIPILPVERIHCFLKQVVIISITFDPAQRDNIKQLTLCAFETEIFCSNFD